MKESRSIKIKLHQHIVGMLHSKIADAKQSIDSAKESRNNDTKSSAGDKYETGRAMMQIEIDKSEVQLSNATNQLNDILKFDNEKKFQKIEPGCLVITNLETYYISIGLGKIIVDGKIFYAISLNSPIGLLLKDKTRGEKISFQGRNLEILNIE
ncbi:MAG TPA: 3-oxoacyl-ACP synthase [Bacteroidia bacterium]|nr:3-oxoacyl-ACP synthase [Bacteroidia bacterium]